MLNSFAMRSTSQSGSLVSAQVDEEIALISTIQSQQDVCTISIHLIHDFGKIYPSHGCPNCPQEVRNTEKIKFQCRNCHERNMLIPRFRFDVNLKDDTGSIIETISGKEREKLLSLTVEQIYELASTKSTGCCKAPKTGPET
ncbi:hypothetical protein BC332_16052 [Capsicum chinense]|nr:hypothetical protein BC332_16052 [Capsicum chinense]